MIVNFLYFLLALFGLGFLVFIHELGHYFMARRVGMKVEAFSIGFGKPFYTWEHQGVKWQLCYLFFGGYVRIAGMEKKGSIEPHEIPDGFYGKRPWQRIQVALMGPIANFIFAFVVFIAIWALGGREKPFSEFTQLIGWVDPQSHLYEEGLRAGDQIESYNHRPYKGYSDLFYAAILDHQKGDLKGYHHDYLDQGKEPFSTSLDSSREIRALLPASYVIYSNPIKDSPLLNSGIQEGDRVLWVDGELIFSQAQLSQVLNQPKTLLTVQRGGKTFLARVPRLSVADLRLASSSLAELDDWQNEAGLKTRVKQLFFIPYNLDLRGVIENAVSYIGADSDEHLPKAAERSPLDTPLERGDRIIAVDGIPVNSSFKLLAELQTKHAQIIVQRRQNAPIPSWKDEDAHFYEGVQWDRLQQMIQSIGTGAPVTSEGELHLLSPIELKPFSAFAAAQSDHGQDRLAAQMKEIEAIKDPKARAKALAQLEQEQNKFKLGFMPQDQLVNYNPSPGALFVSSCKDTWRTLVALFSGNVNPKYMSGPVGIIEVMHHGWGVGVKEALFWMAVISLNLGIFNLLPLPVLDGGHICFSIIESITKKPIKAKVMELLIIPFIILLVAFLIFVTYHDLMRVFGRFF
jgi:regulator of sigma E protease